MILSAEEFVALRTSDDWDLYWRAAHDAAPMEVWLDTIAKYPEMRYWVAHNKTVPVEILAILADDPDGRVRSMVADKRKAGHAILEKLARDSDESVRLRVACNAKTPRDVLEYLTQDEWGVVVEKAKSRLGK